MSNIKRRKFIKVSAYSSLVLASPVLASCFNEPKTSANLAPVSKSRVSAIKGNDLYSITRDAIDAIGGMDKIIDKGDKVFIKPNFVTFPWAKTNNCFRTGECTKPEIIIATTEECLKAGASEVIIGEGSHLPTFDWNHSVTLDGKTDLVEAAKKLNSAYNGKVSLACLEDDSPGWIEVPSATAHGKIAISSLAANADKVISIPVAKTHAWSQLTLAAKNFLGITPLSRYAQLIDNTWWNRGSFDHSSPGAIGQVFLDIVQALKPALSIVDFSVGIEKTGPTLGEGGSTLDVKEKLGTWAVIASTDIMAADASAARIMSHKVSGIKQLNMGYDMNLGEIHAGAIEFVGEKLENMMMPWKPARMKN